MNTRWLISLFVLTSVLWAQPPGNPEMGRPNMDAVRIWKLTEMLALTDEQVATFIPQLQIYERKMREVQKKQQEYLAAGKQLLEKEKLMQKDVDELFRQFQKGQDEIYRIKMDFMESLPEYLSPRQQVMYINFEANFRRDLRRFMHERRGDMKGGNRMPMN